MRALPSALIVSLGLTFAQQAAAQAVDKTASDNVEYNKAVALVWGSITSTDNVVRWCTKNVSKSKKQLVRDHARRPQIDARIDRVMNSSGSFSAEELAAHKADLLKRGAARYDAQLASAPQAEAKHECELLPGYFTTPSFDLEAHFAQELALIRTRPLGK